MYTYTHTCAYISFVALRSAEARVEGVEEAESDDGHLTGEWVCNSYAEHITMVHGRI